MGVQKEVPIVIAAYNRQTSLDRLLISINRAIIPEKVKLIISIDKGHNKDVIELANRFQWKHGEKEIIIHVENLGLRNHILRCGEFLDNYDGMVLLEDDLVVSPGFYIYALKAIEQYQNDPGIAGISLYSHRYNETAQLPFIPLIDDADVFFMQIPSSWGQCWTKQQWTAFRKWYDKNQLCKPGVPPGLPHNVASWPESSWKKYFFWYLIEEDKFFLYPRFSLSTNCGDPGTHFHKKLRFQHVPVLSTERNFRFKDRAGSLATYDAFCEILPESINNVTNIFGSHRFTVDLYGMKHADQIKTKYILTSRSCRNPIMSFAREIKPIENNVFYNLPGVEIHFAKLSDCDLSTREVHLMENDILYYYNIRDYQLSQNTIIQIDYSVRDLIKMLIRKL